MTHLVVTNVLTEAPIYYLLMTAQEAIQDAYSKTKLDLQASKPWRSKMN